MKPAFTFAFLPDAQLGMNSPSGLGAPDSDAARLRAAVRLVNESAAEFVILGGDQVNAGGDHEIAKPALDAELDLLELVLRQLDVPYYSVAGNHDLGPEGEAWPYVERGFTARFSMQHKGVAFIGLNAVFLRGDYGPDRQEAEWAELRRAFAEIPETCSQRFVVTHWPLFWNHPGEDETYCHMPNRREIIDFFVAQKVSCVLSGHLHQDVDMKWHGIPLVGAMSTAKPLFYPEAVAFKLVTVFDGGWSVRRVSVADA